MKPKPPLVVVPLHRLRRMAWKLAWLLLFRPSPDILHSWRRFLLTIFGARIGAGAHIYPSVKVWAPWNLEMAEGSCLGPWVDCYSVDRVRLDKGATVSQYTYLCAASHDIRDPNFKLVTAPISIGAKAWISAGAFVGPGVDVGEGAVLGARACAFRSLKAWTVYGGNPARILGKRVVRNSHEK